MNVMEQYCQWASTCDQLLMVQNAFEITGYGVASRETSHLSSYNLTDMEDGVTSYTNLLIIGDGPAGLMAAAWASRYNASARVLDKKSARVSRGHADALQCRTMEILDSCGLADRCRKEGFHDIETCYWVRSEHSIANESVDFLLPKGFSWRLRHTQDS